MVLSRYSMDRASAWSWSVITVVRSLMVQRHYITVVEYGADFDLFILRSSYSYLSFRF